MSSRTAVPIHFGGAAKGVEQQVRRNQGRESNRLRLGSLVNTGSLSLVPRRVERYRG
jgi:hypothetical protein